jgi:hypothetical protein
LSTSRSSEPTYRVKYFVIHMFSDGHEERTEEIREIPESQYLAQQMAWRKLWQRLLAPPGEANGLASGQT